MNIIDSSCWIEYLMDTEIGASVAPVIEKSEDLIVPTITLYEVYKKLLTEKDENYASEVITYMQTGNVVELNVALSISAAEVSRKFKLSLADSVIYATSLEYSATIYSCDKHFKEIQGVHYFQKTSQ